jgi:hypothetical protein
MKVSIIIADDITVFDFQNFFGFGVSFVIVSYGYGGENKTGKNKLGANNKSPP